MKHLHAQLLSFISKNFTYLIHDPDIKHLTKDDLKLLLKHKHLYVTSEDEVVKAVSLWAEGQAAMIKSSPQTYNKPSSVSNQEILYARNLANLQQDLSEVLPNVNWDFVSLPCLLDIVRSDPLLRINQTFQK
jgi:hypothetical protein